MFSLRLFIGYAPENRAGSYRHIDKQGFQLTKHWIFKKKKRSNKSENINSNNGD